MGRITDITRQKGNKNRVNVFIDGSFFCGLDELTAVKHRLKAGDEVDEDELAIIQADSEYAVALDKALGYLSLRARSEKEISDYLKGKGYLRETAAKVKDRLRELGYLDDAAYARKYVDENRTRFGAYRLKGELSKRGVSADVIEQVLENEDFDEEATALARTLAKSCRDKRKLKERLLRKGYGFDEISRAVGELEEEGYFEETEV